MSRTTKKIEKIAKGRDFEEADTGALTIALSNLEIVSAIESQEKRLKSIESRLSEISKSLDAFTTTFAEMEKAKTQP